MIKMKKIFMLVSIIILIFYFLNPILEKKELRLNTPLLILKKEPNNYYRLYDDYKSEYKYKHLYVDGILKYKNMWVGYIEKCYISNNLDEHGEGLPERYLRSEMGNSGIIIEYIDTEECKNILKNREGYFIVNERGHITYKLSIYDIKRILKINKIKLKNPNYYIQKFGEIEDINEFYFSKDETVRMHQKPSVVKRRAYIIRNASIIVLIIINILLNSKTKLRFTSKFWTTSRK